MPKKPELPQTRRHVMIFDEDWDFLEAQYGPQSANPQGVSAVVRIIIHAKVNQLKAKANIAFEKIREEQQEEKANGTS